VVEFCVFPNFYAGRALYKAFARARPPYGVYKAFAPAALEIRERDQRFHWKVA